jgi:hypothetical protein
MSTVKIYTDALVELYSMSKMYAEEHGATERQEYAIGVAESFIQNLTGYEITQPYEP